MARSGIQAVIDSDVTPLGEQMLDFDDESFKAIAEVYNNEGNDEYLRKNYSNAVYFYTEGIKVNSKDDELKAELYSNRAEAHFCLGNYSDSLRDAKAATDLQPSLVIAIKTGANASVKLNMFEEAIKWCEKGLAIAKENSTLLELRKLSLACADKRRSDSEIGATDEKLSQGKECKHGEHNRASQIKAFKLSEFKTELSEAKDAGDKDREGAAYLNLGLAYYSFNDFKTAIDLYQHALIIFKEVGDKKSEGLAYNHIGNAYDSLGDFKNAVEFHQLSLSIAQLIGRKDLEGKAYRKLGNAYDCLGDFNKAIELHQQALSIAKNIGSKYLEGCAYLGLGNGYDSLGNLKIAIEFHQEALSIAKEVERKDLEGKAYLNLGNAYHSLGEFKEAIDFHQQALSIAKIIGSKDSEAKAYLNLGNAYDSLGDFKKSIEFHQRALNIANVIGNKDLEGNAYNNLGLAYESLGDLEKSMKFHQQALGIAKETGNKDSEGNACGNLGLVYECLGDFRKAIECHQRTLSIAKDNGNKCSEGNAYLNLGNAFESLGDFKKAIDFDQQALCIAKKVGSKDLEGKAYTNLGNAYHSLGDFKKAIAFHQQGLSIAKDIGNKDSEGAAYMNLGNAYSRLDDFEKAIEFHQQALRIAKEAGRTYTEEKAYINLGLACLALGDVVKGIEFHQQALRIAKDIGSKDSEGMAYLNLGNANFFLGNTVKAIEFHEQALSIAKETEHKYLEGKAYLSLGLAYDSLGDFTRAEDFFKSSVRSFDEMRDLLQSNDEWKIGLRSQYDMAYSNLWRLQLRQDKTTEALLTAERGRAQALMDLMELQYGVKSARPVSGEQIETISRISSYLPSLTIFLAEAPNSVNFWVLRNGQQCQFIKKEINNNLESLIDETYKQIGVFEQVMCENRSLNEQADDESEEAPNRSPVDKGLASSGKVDALQTLSDVVIGPILHLIQDDEIIIVPDGPLFLVPYAALVDQHFRYLSETVKIRLVPSLTTLKLMAECPEGLHSTSGALLVGDPLVENVRIKGKAVEQLPSAKREVEMIGNILKIKPFTGKDATKAQVLGRFNSVALVHIAAHGCPETGEILLSPNHGSSNTPNENDYLLTMADVLNTKLHARLVVLSCCYSGRGKIKAEGVVGIARAFLGAGARSVLASLWAIDDDATLEFMKKFYESLMAGQSTRKSLNQAMNWMRESDSFKAVKYWAPFVLIGDDVTFNFGQTSNVSAH